jgi:serine/threonine protein kinase/Flp pilus assembly protein TadD
MIRPITDPQGNNRAAASAQLDDFVAAFEAARGRGGRDDLAEFLPERGHPLYLEALRELVRVDLELGWEQGRPRPLEEYRRRFPELFADPDSLAAIAFEEYRLRRAAGENPTPAEYERRYGLPVTDWPAPLSAGREPHLRLDPGAPTNGHLDEVDAPTDWIRGPDLAPPPEAAAPDSTPLSSATLPQAGDEFLGFRLVSELGRGAIGCVFLARQAALADRLVALKVAPTSLGESQTLAQLQHTHIVPIYSVHTAGALQAVCMPYFGRTTLADVLHDLAARPSLPQSGLELLSTLHHPDPTRRLEDRGSRLEARGSKDEETAAAASSALDPRSSILDPRSSEVSGGQLVASRNLQGLSYVEGVLWLGRCLADGLAHAHERGIVHHDLKPANVLITDEGQPMLLDFNLAEDTKGSSPSEAIVGGTLPYMAPEQLAVLRSGQGTVDARGDLFSLGVLLFELLTRKPPYPARAVPRADEPEAAAAALGEMIRDRSGAPPAPRRLNRMVSPAVDAIVRRCLEPDPDRRYGSARELQEDLQRQLDHRPLRYTREPSLSERAHKWLHRHPRLPLRLLAGVAAVLLGLALALGLRSFHLARSEEALTTLERFRADLHEARTALSAPGADLGQRARGDELGRRALERFAVLDNPSWRESRLVESLPSVEQEQLHREAGDLLLLLARARALPEVSAPGARPDRHKELRAALALNRQAEGCYPAAATPLALWLQRADLHRQLGERAEAEACRARIAGQDPQSAEDHYLLAREHAAAGRFRAAVPLLREATRGAPQHFWAWFLLGNCHDELGDDGSAVSCYSSCIVLAPESSAAFFNRGLAHLRRKDYPQARADLTRAIELRPDQSEAYINRALARQGQKDLAGAIEDFTAALKHGAAPTRVYFMRSRARLRAGDGKGANWDRAEGLRREPADEKSWIARGLARLPADPAAALADFERALALNPRSRAALQNKAHVLAEKLKRPEEAIRVLDQAVALYPDYVPARGGRGVVQARLGRRDAALEDARGCLTRDGHPRTRYQVACIYALTSRQAPADGRRALDLLAEVLRQGYGVNLLATDSDLNSLRGLPEFQRLAAAAAALQAVTPARRASP